MSQDAAWRRIWQDVQITFVHKHRGSADLPNGTVQCSSPSPTFVAILHAAPVIFAGAAWGIATMEATPCCFHCGYEIDEAGSGCWHQHRPPTGAGASTRRRPESALEHARCNFCCKQPPNFGTRPVLLLDAEQKTIACRESPKSCEVWACREGFPPFDIHVLRCTLHASLS